MNRTAERIARRRNEELAILSGWWMDEVKLWGWSCVDEVGSNFRWVSVSFAFYTAFVWSVMFGIVVVSGTSIMPSSCLVVVYRLEWEKTCIRWWIVMLTWHEMRVHCNRYRCTHIKKRELLSKANLFSWQKLSIVRELHKYKKNSQMHSVCKCRTIIIMPSCWRQPIVKVDAKPHSNAWYHLSKLHWSARHACILRFTMQRRIRFIILEHGMYKRATSLKPSVMRSKGQPSPTPSPSPSPSPSGENHQINHRKLKRHLRKWNWNYLSPC